VFITHSPPQSTHIWSRSEQPFVRKKWNA